MSLEASEVAVRVRLLGGTAFEREAQGVAKSVEEIGAAGKKADLANSLGGGAEVAGRRVKTLEDHIGSLGRKLQGIGMGLAPVSAGLAYLGVTASRAAASFQGSMMQLVTQANLPRKNLQGLTKDVQALATVVGQTPQNLSSGLFQIVSSGIHSTARAMSILKTTGIMASVGGDTVQSSSSALMSMLNTHLPGASNPLQVAAYIEAAIGQGKAHMDQINGSMTSGVLPMLKRTGMGLPDFLASMAALSREGVPPEQFASRMRLTLTSVTAPTKAALAAFARLGLAPGALAGDLNRPGHLLAMLDDLQMHAARLPGGARGQLANALIASVFGKSRGMGNIAGLLDSLPQMQSIYNAVSTASPGLLMGHWRETQGTSQFKQQQINAAWHNALITLGTTINTDLLPTLTNVVLWFSRLVTDFGHLNPHLRKLIVLIGAGVVVLSPLLIALGGLLRAVSGIVGMMRWAKTWIQAFGLASEQAAGKEALAGAEASSGLGLFGKGLLRVIPLLGLLATALHALPHMANAAKNGAHWLHRVVTDPHGAATQGVQHYLTTGSMNMFSDTPGRGGFFNGLKHDFHTLFGWIPGLADGGLVQRGGLTLVGERGPELLTLPMGSQVTPLPGNALSDIRASFGDGSGDIHLTTNVVLDGKIIGTTVATYNRKKRNRK